ncbi:hypothetical protein [Uliginosibacterium gangwonense]|uniref:hypothetical protein n=1 Tax=Uliginosibacterium gangwonense TaxID=392736 RepID=UPI00038140AF|nr:hypothetical protein [Uliginosibacterium gangwonense]
MTDFVTVVIRLPASGSTQQSKSVAPSVGDQLLGGEVVGVAFEDSITILDLIEGHVDFESEIAQEARMQAVELAK